MLINAQQIAKKLVSILSTSRLGTIARIETFLDMFDPKQEL